MKDFFQNLPASRQHIIALAILFVIPLILFFDTTLGGKELQRHDITQYRAAVESVYEYQEQFGEEPLWANNIYGGMPSYVIAIEKAVPHLDNLDRYFKTIYPAFQFWVLLGGMYFFLTLMGFKPLTACFGSIIFGLTSYFPIIIIAGHTSKFVALGFIPWLLSGYWMLMKKEKKLLGLFIITVAMALEIRAGHPQITYYYFYLIGGLFIFDSYRMIQEKRTKTWITLGLLLAAGVLIGALGNAEKVLALQEYAHYSLRGGSAVQGTTTMDTGYAFGWSQGISETLTLLIPDLFGGSGAEYWGPKTFTSGPHYFGAVAFVFFVIALFKVREKNMFVFLAVGTLGILFAWGGNFLILNQFAFDYIPFFNKFRAPETWLVLTVLCYTVVAVYGFNWLLDFTAHKAASFKQLYAPIGTILATLLILFIGVNSMSFIKQGEVANIANQIAQQNQVSVNNPQVQQQANNYVKSRLVPEREEKAKGDILRLALFIIITTGLVFAISNSKIGLSIGSFILIILISFDMINVDQRYMPEQNFVASNINPVNYLESQRRDIDQFIEGHISENSTYPYRVFPLLDSPFQNATGAYFYPIIGGYTAAKLSVVQDVLMAQDGPLFSGPSGINLGLLALLNTKYITYNQPLGIPGLTPVFRGNSGVVLQLDEVLPKAFFVDSTITTNDPVDAYNHLYPGVIDFSNTAVIEDFTAETSPDSSSSVEVSYYTGPEMTIKTSRSKPGFLVISEIYYPEGWEALLDGEEIPIHKTNYLLRGVQVPAGEHTLEFDFKPRSIALGSSLSMFSLVTQLILGLFLAFTFFKNRNAKAE